MPNVGTLILNLAKKAGYDTTLLAIPSETFEIPEDLVAALDSKLLTVESAQNNPAIKSYFRSQVLDTVDRNFPTLFDEFEFDEATREEILGIKSTYDRIPAIAKKVKELEAQKAAAGKGDKAALQEQINNLNKQISQLTQDKERAIQEERSKAQQEIADHIFRHSIDSVDLITDMFDKPTMLKLAEMQVRSALAAEGAKAVLKDGVLTLVQASDEALDFYKDNKKVTYNEFRDKVLANAKIIKVTATPPAGQTGAPPVNGNSTPTTIPNGAPATNNALLAKLEAAKAAYGNTGS